MKLYYSPGACSLASHITLHEAGVDFTAETVDLRPKRTESGADFAAINPRGAVPALDLGNGEVLTEGVAIMQHVLRCKGRCRPRGLRPDRKFGGPDVAPRFLIR